MKILCVCLSATIQRTLVFNNFTENKVNRSESFTEDASGKAVNTARVLNQLSKDSASVLCPLGKQNYKDFLKYAKKDNLKVNYVKTPGKTRCCWTLLSKNGDTTEVVADEPQQNLTKKQIDKIEKNFLKKLSKLTKSTDAVIISGSTPKIFSTDLCKRICITAKNNNNYLLADFHGNALLETLTEVSPDVIKINEDEFIQTFNLFETEKSNLADMILQKNNDFNTSFVITRGTDPTLFVSNGQVLSSEIFNVTPINTTACGDSFNAGFINSLFSNPNNKIETHISNGNKTASLNAKSFRPGSII